MAISRRRHSSIASGSCALVLALVGLAGAPTAYASEDPQGGVLGNYTGADVFDPQDDREFTEKAKERIALTEAWCAAQQGISSQSSYTDGPLDDGVVRGRQDVQLQHEQLRRLLPSVERNRLLTCGQGRQYHS